MKENIILDLIQRKAIDYFKSVYEENPENQKIFKIFTTVMVGEDTKDLLILGIMNTRNRYDTCIAVLNPKPEVIQKLEQGCVYTGNSLKRIVSGKCDLMVDLLVKTFKRGWEVKMMRKYQARMP
jgi:hypothetical protein